MKPRRWIYRCLFSVMTFENDFSLGNVRKLIFIFPLVHWGYKNGIGNKGNDIYKPRAIKVQLWLSADCVQCKTGQGRRTLKLADCEAIVRLTKSGVASQYTEIFA